MRIPFGRSLTASAAVAVLGLCGPVSVTRADSDALWNLVSQQCVVDAQQFGDPEPCAKVDLSEGVQRGYAVLKDAVGPRQFLLIPTARITGIESPELLAPDAPNYFAAAWQARSFTEVAAGRAVPREWMSVAVNSALSRSQNQLHIHIDCVRADVHDALRRYAGTVGPAWAPFPVPLAGHTYTAMNIDGEDLQVNPFRLVADTLGGQRMGEQTVVVVGREGGGFVLLTDHADGENGDFAGGEQLQDHTACGPRPQ